MRSESSPPEMARLHHLLAALGPQRIWRPVPAPDGSLLAPGDGSDTSELERYIGDLDVAGKSVADLGCNLGYFTFMARRLGASRVLGLDIDPEIIHIANELAALHQTTNVAFLAVDFLRQPPKAPCDMAMLIDFIGRQIISKGRVGLVAQAAKNWGRRELFFTLRPIYRLDDLPASPQALDAHYPGFVHDNAFHLADALAQALGTRLAPGAT
ncbi:methyltransferase domain-containing protein, partial [Desulfovibrio sp. DV]|uniref:methyltransferase domain-containing protein n=1 Tax=Desulfovibrio sp. DV TaxID=1844708 RepID=UPI00094B7F9D